MASSIIFRRMAFSVTRLTVPAIKTQRNYSFAVFNNGRLSQELCRRAFIPISHFSATAEKADRTLLQVLDSEITCAEEEVPEDYVEEIPDNFPFEIQDNPGKRIVSLRREFQGEVIKVDVHMSELGGDEDGDDNGENGEEAEDDKPSIPLVVCVCKGNGTCLEFGCTAYPDEVTIDSLVVKEPDAPEDDLAYEGPEFMDLDENLQKAFHKYLETRGITPTVTNFLHEYMTTKDSKEYLLWLKNVKKFVEK